MEYHFEVGSGDRLGEHLKHAHDCAVHAEGCGGCLIIQDKILVGGPLHNSVADLQDVRPRPLPRPLCSKLVGAVHPGVLLGGVLHALCLGTPGHCKVGTLQGGPEVGEPDWPVHLDVPLEVVRPLLTDLPLVQQVASSQALKVIFRQQFGGVVKCENPPPGCFINCT